MGCLSFVFLFCGQYLGGRQGLLAGFMFAVCLNSWIYFYSEHFLLKKFAAKEVLGQDAWGLTEVVKEIALKLQIQSPQVFVSKMQGPNAFALGNEINKGKVFITEDIIQKLSPEELRSIIALQMIKIKSGESFLLNVQTQICAFVLSFGYFLDFLFFFPWKQNSNKNFYFFTYALAPICYVLVRFSYSPRNYFTSDAKTIEALGDAKNLAKAIWKLQSYISTQAMQVDFETSQLFTVSPFSNKGILIFFNHHPHFENRIKKMIGYFPI